MLGRDGLGDLFEAGLPDGILAHLVLLDLAADRHWPALDEADVARNLIVRDLAAAELTDVLIRRNAAVVKDDPGAQFFAVAFVRYADDLYVANCRVGIQIFFD